MALFGGFLLGVGFGDDDEENGTVKVDVFSMYMRFDLDLVGSFLVFVLLQIVTSSFRQIKLVGMDYCSCYYN